MRVCALLLLGGLLAPTTRGQDAAVPTLPQGVSSDTMRAIERGPNRAVQTVARAVPSDTECRRLKFILCHAREDVRDVVLNADLERQRAALRYAIGWGRIARFTGHFFRKPGGQVIRMQIRGDHAGLDIIELLEVRDNPSKRRMRRFVFQIADMLADEDLVADGKGH